MAENDTGSRDEAAESNRKPGFFGRLFGRGDDADGPESAPPEAPVPENPPAASETAPATAESASESTEPAAVASPAQPDEAATDEKPSWWQRLRQAAAPLAEPPAAVPPPDIAAEIPASATLESPEPAVAPPAPAAAETATEKRSWWQRLRQGLARSSNSLGKGISDVFSKRKLDAATLDDLEDVLIQADLGVAMAERIRDAVGEGRYDKMIEPDEVRAILAAEVEKVLAPVAKPLVIDADAKPFVVLVVGVNGSGKTTTIGKLAANFSDAGRKVMLAAGDTFRAAAIEQLQIWGERIGAPVVARAQGADSAGLAFEAIRQAQAEQADLLLMDTAGRLQNRAELMAELEKILRVMKKVEPQAPHAVLLVLDATIGQNAMNQVEIFGRKAGVTGLVMTKLDGTARGGILVAIAERFKLPVHFIGVGEGRDDLEPFAARDFARAIAGLEQ